VGNKKIINWKMNTAHVKNAIEGQWAKRKREKDFNVKPIIDWRNFNLPEHMPIGADLVT